MNGRALKKIVEARAFADIYNQQLKGQPMTDPTTNPMIHVGLSPEALVELRKSIVEILSIDRCGDGPKSEAMITLRGLADSTKSVTIRDCMFTSTTPAPAVKIRAIKAKR